MRVLDVGVTSDTIHPESNLFEKLYPYPEQITCVGTEDGSHLEAKYSGLRFSQIVAGQNLPFGDGEFDIVFSNAVIEHVGSRRAQAAFVREICRVGKGFFITTPNRWFPVEHHTGLPLLHFLPPASFRAIIRNSRYSYWATEETLNLLTAGEFIGLFPDSVDARLSRAKVAGITSNLAVYGNSRV